jgi:hypothetical protein
VSHEGADHLLGMFFVAIDLVWDPAANSVFAAHDKDLRHIGQRERTQ